MSSPLRILLLEDNPRDAELAERTLRKAGLEFIIKRVSSEAGFRAEVVAGTYDLILADFHLGDFTGLQALQIVRQLSPEMPFIFVSGSIGEERAIEALRDGAADYILKDRPQRLPTAIASVLAKKQNEQAQRRMQDQLVESEQRFHFVAQATKDVIWDWHLENDSMWVNDALRTEWGYDFEDSDINYQAWAKRIHPDDVARVTESLRAATESTSDRWVDEYRFRHADQSYGFVYDRRIIIRRPNGRAIRVIGAMQDVTKIRLSEHRAAEAERIAHLGHWSFDFGSQRREWSAQMFRIFRIDPREPLTNEKILSVVHEADRGVMKRVMSGGAPGREFHFRIVDIDGRVRTIQTRVEFERNADGSLARMFGTSQDVTDRVEAERKIRELSRVNELILSYAAEGIVAVDVEGKVVFANPAAERLLAWPHGTQIDDLHRTLHPRDEHGQACELAENLRFATSRTGDAQFYTSSGEAIDVRYSCGAILEEGRISGSVLTFADVSTRKRLERQLEQANRVSSLGRIAATIAHEFNNVLMGIQPFAEIVRQRATDEKLQQAGTQILASVARGRRITHDMLRTTHLAEPELAPVELGAWLQQLEPELAVLLGSSIKLHTHRPDQPLYGLFDSAQMQQVVTNLAANARDAMTAGGELTIKIDSTRYRDKPMARITVTDTGVGIPARVLPMIFEPLFTTKRTGTGLGLAVVQQVINKNGGSIEVSSAEGKGTTFTILLRVADGKGRSAAERSADVGFQRLLLVEDDPTVADGLATLLQMEGLAVRVVNRGRQALEAAAEFHPDAAVIDVGLPDMDGAEVYDQLMKRWPDLPVVFSTGQGEAARLEQQLTNPSVRLLAKPYDVALLLDTLREIA